MYVATLCWLACATLCRLICFCLPNLRESPHTSAISTVIWTSYTCTIWHITWQLWDCFWHQESAYKLFTDRYWRPFWAVPDSSFCARTEDRLRDNRLSPIRTDSSVLIMISRGWRLWCLQMLQHSAAFTLLCFLKLNLYEKSLTCVQACGLSKTSSKGLWRDIWAGSISNLCMLKRESNKTLTTFVVTVIHPSHYFQFYLYFRVLNQIFTAQIEVGASKKLCRDMIMVDHEGHKQLYRSDKKHLIK